MRTNRVLLASLLVFVNCSGDGGRRAGPSAAGSGAEATPEPLRFTVDEAASGVVIELSEVAAPVVTGGSAAPMGDVTVMSAGQAEKLLARLPAIEGEDGDAVAFAKREDSKPPPVVGETVSVSFPPPVQVRPPEVVAGPPTLLRYAPEGEVDLAPYLSLTFSQPMVAVSSQEEAARVRPVKLTPEPPGQWRWIGAKTVVFEPDGRFPAATDYKVEVLADAKSAAGVQLDKGSAWAFSTPPVKVLERWPSGGSNVLDPIVFLGFDQKIPANMAEFVVVRGGGSDVPLRALTQVEIDASPWVKQAMARAGGERGLALKPAEPLKPSTSYQVTVKKGAPSAEGPRLSTADQSQSFRTYDALALQNQWCDRDSSKCSMRGTLTLRFNNELMEDGFDPALVTISPAVDKFKVVMNGASISVSGDFVAEQNYVVRVGAELKDNFGQTLGKELTAKFSVVHEEPQLYGPPREMLVLDPAAPASFSVFSTNMQGFVLSAYAVKPEDLGPVSKWMSEVRYDGYTDGTPPVKRVSRGRVPVSAYQADTLVETPVDLTAWLGASGFGHVLLQIEPEVQPKERWQQVRHYVWVQRTSLGLTAIVDQDEIITWATSLGDGSAAEGVEVSLLGEASGLKTGADGTVTLAKYVGGQGPHALVARRGEDVALLPEQDGWWNQYGSWYKSLPGDSVNWLVYDDRKLYKPGESVRVKGWARIMDNGPGGGLKPKVGSLAGELTWQLFDSQYQLLSEGKAQADENGGFDLDVALPKTPNLGDARIELRGRFGNEYGSYTHSFQIQEFRRPEYEVNTSVDPRPYYLGESARVTVKASYYAGGALPLAPTSWTVVASPAWFTPPGLEEYRFGSGEPHYGGMWGRGGFGRYGGYPEESWNFALSGETDASGEHTMKMDFVSIAPPRALTVRAEATVVDVNRQRWTSAQSVLVHPASIYAGLSPDKGFYEPGDEVGVRVVVADVEGGLVSGVPVAVKLSRLEWAFKDGRWQELEQAPLSCDVTSGADASLCEFAPGEGGSYRLRARVVDAEGRPNETRTTVYVSGGVTRRPPSRQIEMQDATLVADKLEYQPGDTARLLVQSPFSPAEGLLTVGRNGVMETRRFSLPTGTATLELPIGENGLPNLVARVDIVGAEPRQDDQGKVLEDKARRVAYASAQLDLAVPPLARTLAVKVAPKVTSVDPGGSTTIDVTVLDAAGKPVVGEVALVVVDESVLTLAGYETPDPISVFYATQSGGFSDAHSRRLVVLADPDLSLAAGQEGALGEASLSGFDALGGGKGGIGGMMADEMSEGRGRVLAKEELSRREAPRRSLHSAMPMAPPTEASATTGTSSSGPQITVREDFSALALFAPRVRTDAQGKASVPLTLPDSLTRYRIMAVVVADEGGRFGVGESSITARKPVMLRPSPPRFLNFGDRAELPLVVQNQTDQPMKVELGLRVLNARVIERVDKPVPAGAPTFIAGRTLTIPANDRREVRVPIAAEMAGTARFQAVVVSAGHTDAASFDFPVWTPATSESFATYGQVDEGAVMQKVKAPDAVWPQFGGLEITTSSTALSALTDAMVYLASYPYDCTEQIASRVVSVSALKDVLGAFGAPQLPSAEALKVSVDGDLERIRKRQHPNGGFSYWPTLQDEPYLSVHTTHALVRAKKAGFAVDESALVRAQQYLQQIERHIPHYYSLESRRVIVAYSLHVRRLMGDLDGNKAMGLMRDRGVKLPLDAQGWIAPVLAETGHRAEAETLIKHWETVVTETAAGAQFASAYQDEGDFVLLHSERRTDAVLMEALISITPKHDLVPKVVTSLLGHRNQGRWGSTQENALVLLALNEYFRAYESVTPDFVARTWLGDRYAGEHAFRGYTTERAETLVPMAWMTDPGGEKDLVLAKEGAGRMYYRVGMRYAPLSLDLEPADYGFTVTRRYEGLDQADDVTRDSDGVWHVKAGARVRVKLEMVVPARRTHVALVDPMPGGFEALNPSLATTGTLPADPAASTGRYWWWNRAWYEHQNLRDERAEAFASQVWAGVHTYSYIATATTPGHFVVPPAKAEEMYHPETFGRSGTERLVIE